MSKVRSNDLTRALKNKIGGTDGNTNRKEPTSVKSSLQRMTNSLQGKLALTRSERLKLGMRKQGVAESKVHEIDKLKVEKVVVGLKTPKADQKLEVDFVLQTTDASKKIAVQVPLGLTIEPVIYLCDNLLRASKYIDLNACHLSTVNNENSITFTPDNCRKLHAGKVQFYVESLYNPLEDMLKPKVRDENCRSKLLHFVPSYFEDTMFEVKMLSIATKKVRYAKVGFAELVEIDQSDKLKVQQVYGNLTQAQAKQLGLRHKKGQHFVFYEKG